MASDLRFTLATSLMSPERDDFAARMLVVEDSFSELEKIEARLADELVKLLESNRETKEDLEKLQIKLNMVHETQIQAAHLAYEDVKKLELVSAEELLKPGESKRPRHMRI